MSYLKRPTLKLCHHSFLRQLLRDTIYCYKKEVVTTFLNPTYNIVTKKYKKKAMTSITQFFGKTNHVSGLKKNSKILLLICFALKVTIVYKDEQLEIVSGQSYPARKYIHQLQATIRSTKNRKTNKLLFFSFSEADYTLDDSFWNDESPVGK